MQAYTPGSAEYVSLYNQVHGIIVYDKIQIPAKELISGRWKYRYQHADFKGGILNANAAKELTINNQTAKSSRRAAELI